VAWDLLSSKPVSAAPLPDLTGDDEPTALRLRLARALLARGETSAARAEVERALAAAPDDPRILGLFAVIALRAGDAGAVVAGGHWITELCTQALTEAPEEIRRVSALFLRELVPLLAEYHGRLGTEAMPIGYFVTAWKTA